MDIPTTLLSLLGFILLIGGGVLILAGVGVITIEQYVRVIPGKRAWISGIFLALLGAILLSPEAHINLFPSSAPTTVALNTPTVEAFVQTPPPGPTLLDTPTVSTNTPESISSTKTSTPTPTYTSLPTETPTTDTPTPTSTGTSTGTPTLTSTPTQTPTFTPTPTPTNTIEPPPESKIPQTPEEAANLFGGPSAKDWQRCPEESNCWWFELPGNSYRVQVPENCLRPDGSIDGWRYKGDYPEKPDSIEGEMSIWNNLEGATIRCR